MLSEVIVRCSGRIQRQLIDRFLLVTQKMNSLRLEADKAIERAEEAESKVKKYEQQILEKEQEIASLNHRLGLLDSEHAQTEDKLNSLKQGSLDIEQTKTMNETLTRKVNLLEEELDSAEKNLKETVEKCVSSHRRDHLLA